MSLEHDSTAPDSAAPGNDHALQQEIDAALSAGSLMDMVDAEEMAARADRDKIRKGTVIAIQGEDIFIDVGAKSEGYLPVSQFETGKVPAVGDLVEVVIDGFDADDGILRLSRQGAIQQATWQNLQVGQLIEGRVTGHNKGGLEMDFSGVQGFMPLSQIDRFRVEDASGYVDQKLQCEVVEVKRKERTIVVSRRNILQKQAEEARERAFTELAPGQRVEGVVKSIMPYGAFVDIGGVDGLLHISDMAHGRIEDPNTVVKEGQQLELMVLKIDPERRKFSLGLKQILPDPWETAAAQWSANSVVTGRVVKLLDFGAFVELTEGVEGLIPISEMSYARRINHPKEVISAGEMVKVRVLNVDPQKKRISLSIKRLEDDPWSGAAIRWAADTKVQATVKRIETFGAFCELVPGVEGLVHISELSHDRVANVGDVLREGQQIELFVLSVDEDKHRISLSLKGRDEAPDYEAALRAAGQAEADPDKPKRKKKLRGGLER